MAPIRVSGNVVHSSELGWKGGQDVTERLREVARRTLRQGGTLVLEHRYTLKAGSRIEIPPGSRVAAVNGGGFDLVKTDGSNKPALMMSDGSTLHNVTITASGAPNTGYSGIHPDVGVDFDPARAIGIQNADDVTISNSSFSGNIDQFLDVDNSDNLTVVDTHFLGARTHVVLGMDVADATFLRVHFERSLGDGIKTLDGGVIVRPKVIDCLFEDNARDGIDTTGGFKDGLVKDTVFYDNSSALDIKTIIDHPDDLKFKDINSNITLDGVDIIGSGNGIVLTFEDRIGAVSAQMADDYIPHDILVTNSTFEDVGRPFLVKDGYNVTWSDVEFRNVNHDGSDAVRIMNINAPSGWSRFGKQNIGGDADILPSRNLSVDDLWSYDVGPDALDLDGGASQPSPQPEPETIIEPTPVPEPAEPTTSGDETVSEVESAPGFISEPQPASTGDVLFKMDGVRSFDGNMSGVLEVAPPSELNVASATIAFTFNAQDLNGRQGLLSKDASGYDNGDGHFAAYLEGDVLRVRFQSDSGDQILTAKGIDADTDYQFVASFGDGKVAAWLDGQLIGAASSDMSWEGNGEYLQVGGLGWASASGEAGYGQAFDGTISDVVITEGFASSPADTPSTEDDGPLAPEPAPEPVPEPEPEPEAVSEQPSEPETVPEPTPEPELEVETPQADGEGVIFSLSDEVVFDGRSKSVIEMAHSDALNLSTATIDLTFNADDLNGRQGLLTKDAKGYEDDGGHFSAYLEGDSLHVRFQSDSGERTFTASNLSADTDYQVTASFGDGKVAAWLNGELIGKASSDMSWEGNDQFLQIGALGWASGSGKAGFSQVFEGTISDVSISEGFNAAPASETASDASASDGSLSETLSVSEVSSQAEQVSAWIDCTVPQPEVVFDLLGEQDFDGGRSSVLEFASDNSLQIEEGTIAFGFNADRVDNWQGLVSKDAYGSEENSGHFTSYIHDGSLVVRFQNGPENVEFIVDEVEAETDYQVTATFGNGKVAMWFDDELVGETEFDTDWMNNDEFLQVGANGWASKSGDAGFRDMFDGTISDLIILDAAVDNPDCLSGHEDEEVTEELFLF